LIYGGAYALWNAMTAYNVKLAGKKRLRLQLNIENDFNEDELIVTDADQLREYRYAFQTPRRWSVIATLNF